MNLDIVAASFGAARNPKRKQSYLFGGVSALLDTLKELGLSLPWPLTLDRECELYIDGGRLIARIARLDPDPELRGWTYGERYGKPYCSFVVGEWNESTEPPDMVRCVSYQPHDSSILNDAGWRVWNDEHKSWSYKSPGSVRRILQSFGMSGREADQRMGHHERTPYTLVSRPFAPEYPGGRLWNLGAPQLRYAPIPGEHPTWNQVIDHVSAEMGERGRDWLTAWLASIVQRPHTPLPYLFLFGPENSGKSTLHEAFELLVTRGVVKADRALTSQSDMNAELDGAVLCVVEEKDIAKAPGAHAKIKEAVTALRLSIRRMRRDSYMVDNTSHWIQCANHGQACIVTHEDTRVQPLFVGAPPQDVPKVELMNRLTNEAPYFTHTLVTFPLPPLEGRLGLPLVDTPSRLRLADQGTPIFILALLAWLPSVGTFSGTAAELSAQLAECYGDRAEASEFPRDARKATNLLESHSRLLGKAGFVARFGDRTRHGRMIMIGPLA